MISNVSIPSGKDLLRKTDWLNNLNGGVIPRGEEVELWVLPQGAICEVAEVEGVASLRNGNYVALGSPIARMLYDAGVRGAFILNSNEALPQTIPQWITWWLSLDEKEQVQHHPSLRVTLFNKSLSRPMPFQVEIITPTKLLAHDVNQAVFMNSKSQSVSQFLVARNCGEVYRLEPRRSMVATVVDVTDFGVIARSDVGAIFLVERVHHSVMVDCSQQGLKLEDLIGTDVLVHYTMYTPGCRLNNYKSTEITKSLADIATTENDNIMLADPGRFESLSWGRAAGLLSLRRCMSARLSYDKENSIVTAYGEDDDRLLFTIKKGARPGQYTAEIEADGQVGSWAFEPTLCPDTLNPTRFVTAMADRIYFATGLNLRSLGLGYTDRMATVA